MKTSSYSEAWSRRWTARKAAYEHTRLAVQHQVETLLPAATEVLRRNGMREAWLFGSFVDGTWRPDSDVDLAVTMDPPGRRELFRLEAELERLLGQTVHLTVLTALPPAIQDTIRKEGTRLASP